MNQISRKRPRKTVLTTGKKSKKYYDARCSTIHSQKEIDFCNFATFNVDFEDFMNKSANHTPKVSVCKNISTQTGVLLCARSSQTAISVNVSPQATQTDSLPPDSHVTDTVSAEGDKLIALLQRDKIWYKFADKLKKHKQSHAFVNLVTALGCNKMSLDNLSWKCALDMGKLSLCKTTTKMKYDPECIEFFSLFALMFGSSAVDVLRGPANFSQVITDKTRCGLYDPQQGTFNFAIPSLTTLKKVSSGYPKNIPVGLVEHSLCIAEEQAKEHGTQYILGFNGKLVAAGCKGENEGDINLWGRERPSLTFVVKQLEINERLCRDINMEVTTKSKLKHYKLARQLLFAVSEHLRALCERVRSIFYIKKRLIQTCSENPANQLKYMRRISLIHQNSSDCEAVLKLALSTQKTVVELIANEIGTHSLFHADTSVDLSQQQNVFSTPPSQSNAKIFRLNI